MFQFLGLIGSAVSAASSISRANASAASAELNAFMTETQRVQNEVSTKQQSNLRNEQFQFAQSANLALMGGAMSRDISGVDRSVAAFLERQREIAYSDIANVEFQGKQQDLALSIAAMSERRRAADIRASGLANAFTTALTGLMDYNEVRMPSSPPPQKPFSFLDT